jgi:hypothetical protein
MIAYDVEGTAHRYCRRRRGERPHNRRAAEQCNELTPFHGFSPRAEEHPGTSRIENCVLRRSETAA